VYNRYDKIVGVSRTQILPCMWKINIIRENIVEEVPKQGLETRIYDVDLNLNYMNL